jgi:uncharacterized membrane protein
MDLFGETGLFLWLAVLAILITIASYVVAKIRPKPIQPELTAEEWLEKYQELHAKGVLTDEEFRTIKTTLSKRLQEELKDNGDEGSNA